MGHPSVLTAVALSAGTGTADVTMTTAAGTAKGRPGLNGGAVTAHI